MEIARVSMTQMGSLWRHRCTAVLVGRMRTIPASVCALAAMARNMAGEGRAGACGWRGTSGPRGGQRDQGSCRDGYRTYVVIQMSSLWHHCRTLTSVGRAHTMPLTICALAVTAKATGITPLMRHERPKRANPTVMGGGN